MRYLYNSVFQGKISDITKAIINYRNLQHKAEKVAEEYPGFSILTDDELREVAKKTGEFLLKVESMPFKQEYMDRAELQISSARKALCETMVNRIKQGNINSKNRRNFYQFVKRHGNYTVYEVRHGKMRRDLLIRIESELNSQPRGLMDVIKDLFIGSNKRSERRRQLANLQRSIANRQSCRDQGDDLNALLLVLGKINKRSYVDLVKNFPLDFKKLSPEYLDSFISDLAKREVEYSPGRWAKFFNTNKNRTCCIIKKLKKCAIKHREFYLSQDNIQREEEKINAIKNRFLSVQLPKIESNATKKRLLLRNITAFHEKIFMGTRYITKNDIDNLIQEIESFQQDEKKEVEQFVNETREILVKLRCSYVRRDVFKANIDVAKSTRIALDESNNGLNKLFQKQLKPLTGFISPCNELERYYNEDFARELITNLTELKLDLNYDDAVCKVDQQRDLYKRTTSQVQLLLSMLKRKQDRAKFVTLHDFLSGNFVDKETNRMRLMQLGLEMEEIPILLAKIARFHLSLSTMNGELHKLPQKKIEKMLSWIESAGYETEIRFATCCLGEGQGNSLVVSDYVNAMILANKIARGQGEAKTKRQSLQFRVDVYLHGASYAKLLRFNSSKRMTLDVETLKNCRKATQHIEIIKAILNQLKREYKDDKTGIFEVLLEWEEYCNSKESGVQVDFIKFYDTKVDINQRRYPKYIKELCEIFAEYKECCFHEVTVQFSFKKYNGESSPYFSYICYLHKLNLVTDEQLEKLFDKRLSELFLASSSFSRTRESRGLLEERGLNSRQKRIFNRVFANYIQLPEVNISIEDNVLYSNNFILGLANVLDDTNYRNMCARQLSYLMKEWRDKFETEDASSVDVLQKISNLIKAGKGFKRDSIENLLKQITDKYLGQILSRDASEITIIDFLFSMLKTRYSVDLKKNPCYQKWAAVKKFHEIINCIENGKEQEAKRIYEDLLTKPNIDKVDRFLLTYYLHPEESRGEIKVTDFQLEQFVRKLDMRIASKTIKTVLAINESISSLANLQNEYKFPVESVISKLSDLEECQRDLLIKKLSSVNKRNLKKFQDDSVAHNCKRLVINQVFQQYLRILNLCLVQSDLTKQFVLLEKHFFTFATENLMIDILRMIDSCKLDKEVAQAITKLFKILKELPSANIIKERCLLQAIVYVLERLKKKLVEEKEPLLKLKFYTYVIIAGKLKNTVFDEEIVASELQALAVLYHELAQGFETFSVEDKIDNFPGFLNAMDRFIELVISGSNNIQNGFSLLKELMEKEAIKFYAVFPDSGIGCLLKAYLFEEMRGYLNKDNHANLMNVMREKLDFCRKLSQWYAKYNQEELNLDFFRETSRLIVGLTVKQKKIFIRILETLNETKIRDFILQELNFLDHRVRGNEDSSSLVEKVIEYRIETNLIQARRLCQCKVAMKRVESVMLEVLRNNSQKEKGVVDKLLSKYCQLLTTKLDDCGSKSREKTAPYPYNMGVNTIVMGWLQSCIAAFDLKNEAKVGFSFELYGILRELYESYSSLRVCITSYFSTKKGSNDFAEFGLFVDKFKKFDNKRQVFLKFYKDLSDFGAKGYIDKIRMEMEDWSNAIFLKLFQSDNAFVFWRDLVQINYIQEFIAAKLKTFFSSIYIKSDDFNLAKKYAIFAQKHMGDDLISHTLTTIRKRVLQLAINSASTVKQIPCAELDILFAEGKSIESSACLTEAFNKYIGKLKNGSVVDSKKVIFEKFKLLILLMRKVGEGDTSNNEERANLFMEIYLATNTSSLIKEAIFDLLKELYGDSEAYCDLQHGSGRGELLTDSDCLHGLCSSYIRIKNQKMLLLIRKVLRRVFLYGSFFQVCGAVGKVFASFNSVGSNQSAVCSLQEAFIAEVKKALAILNDTKKIQFLGKKLSDLVHESKRGAGCGLFDRQIRAMSENVTAKASEIDSLNI